MSLDDACTTCGRPIAVHLVPEWLECSGRVAEDLPFDGTGPGPMPTFTLEGRDLSVADHLTARALVSEPVQGWRIPVVLLTFSVGIPDEVPAQVAEVAFVSDPEMMRKTGRLLQATCFGAAKRVDELDGGGRRGKRGR